MIVPMITIKVIHLRAFKKFPNKCLGDKAVYKESSAAHISRGPVSQPNFYIR